MFQAESFCEDRFCAPETNKEQNESRISMEEPTKNKSLDRGLILDVRAEEDAVELNIAEADAMVGEERHDFIEIKKDQEEEYEQKVEVYLDTNTKREPSHRMSRRNRDPREEECIRKLDLDMLEILSVSSGITDPDYGIKQRSSTPIRKLLCTEQKGREQAAEEEDFNIAYSVQTKSRPDNQRSRYQDQVPNKKTQGQRKSRGRKGFQIFPKRNNTKVSKRRPIGESTNETINYKSDESEWASKESSRRRDQAEKMNRELVEQAKRKEAELRILEEKAMRQKQVEAENKRRVVERLEQEEKQRRRAVEEEIKRQEEKLRELEEQAKRREEEAKIRQRELEEEAKRLQAEAERKEREAELREQQEQAKRREAKAKIKRYELEEEARLWREKIQMIAEKHSEQQKLEVQRLAKQPKEVSKRNFVWNDSSNFTFDKKDIEPDAALSISSSITGPTVWKIDSLDEFMDAASIIDSGNDPEKLGKLRVATKQKEPENSVPSTSFASDDVVWETFDDSVFNAGPDLDFSWEEQDEFLPTNPSPVSVVSGAKAWNKPVTKATVERLHFDNFFLASMEEEESEILGKDEKDDMKNFFQNPMSADSAAFD